MLFLSLFFSFILLNSSLDFNLLHKHWKIHFERKFAISNVFPLIKRLAGNEGNILEVGCENYNQYDVRFAEVNPKRWYFVDVVKRGFSEETGGHQIVYPNGFRDMNKPEWQGKFTVIYDNILQFFANSTMNGSFNVTQIDEHISLYPKLLTPGGWLLKKIDGWNPRNYHNWPVFKTKIANAGLVLTQVTLQMTSACNTRARDDFLSWELERGSHVKIDYPEYHTCERTIWAQFYYPGESWIYKGERNITNL